MREIAARGSPTVFATSSWERSRYSRDCFRRSARIVRSKSDVGIFGGLLRGSRSQLWLLFRHERSLEPGGHVLDKLLFAAVAAALDDAFCRLEPEHVCQTQKYRNGVRGGKLGLDVEDGAAFFE